MSHEIMMVNGKACIAVREGSDLPWHRFANWTPADASMDVWAENSGMNYKVQKSRVRFATSREQDSAEYAAWDDKVVLFHSVTQKPVGLVSNRYKVFQPAQVLAYVYEAARDHGLTLDVMGVLFDGAKVWALANYGEESVLGRADRVKGNLLVSTSFDGSQATEFRNTLIRVVCRNTLEAAQAHGAKAAYSVRHRTTVDLNAADHALGFNKDKLQSGFAESMASLRKLAAQPWTPAMLARATLELFKPSKVEVDDLGEKERTEILEKRVPAAINRLAMSGELIGRDMAGGQGTAYAWLNAVTQYVDHASAAHSVENRIDSALMGRGADLKNRAFDVAKVLVAAA